MRVGKDLRTIVIACGTGAVTSAIIKDAVTEILSRHEIQANIIKCRFSEIDQYLGLADLVITSVALRETAGKPVISAAGFFTGTNQEVLESDIVRLLA